MRLSILSMFADFQGARAAKGVLERELMAERAIARCLERAAHSLMASCILAWGGEAWQARSACAISNRFDMHRKLRAAGGVWRSYARWRGGIRLLENRVRASVSTRSLITAFGCFWMILNLRRQAQRFGDKQLRKTVRRALLQWNS